MEPAVVALSVLLSLAHAQPTTLQPRQSALASDLASDGSGSSPYLHSPPFLLFAIESLVIGAFLVVFGKRAWKTTTGLGLGLALELVTWIIIVNVLPAKGFSSASSDEGRKDIIIWAIVSAAGLLGLALGSAPWFWYSGMVAIGGCGGLSLALSIVMMANDDLPAVARWIIVGVLTAAGLVIFPLFQKNIGMVVATALTGSFLLFLGIDLFVNKTDGMSLGLRYAMDHNSVHRPALTGYSPSTSTRVFLALIWVVTIIASVFQAFVWRHAPFIRTYRYLNDFENEAMEQQLNREVREVTPSPSIPGTPGSQDADAAQINRRYRHATQASNDDEKGQWNEKDSLRGPSPLHESIRESGFEFIRGGHVGGSGGVSRHPRDMTSPDEPPSRPASIVSTTFADGLRSRPPTFFDEPTTRPALAKLSPPQPLPNLAPDIPVSPTDISLNPTRVSTNPTDISFEIPITSTIPHPTVPAPALLNSPRRTSTSTDSSSSNTSRRSYRKPVPGVVEENSSLSLRDSAVQRDLTRGLESGRDFSLAPSTNTPSSGADISTLLGGNFGFPKEPSPDPMIGRRKEPEAEAPEVRVGTSRAQVRSPEFTSSAEATNHPSWAANHSFITDPSHSSRDQSFRTASEDGDERPRTPELGHGRGESRSEGGSSFSPATPTTIGGPFGVAAGEKKAGETMGERMVEL